MKRKWIFFVFCIALIITIVLRYSGIMVFRFSTPAGSLSKEETELFDRIKSSYRIDKVWREPKYDVDSTGEPLNYRIIAGRLACGDGEYIRKLALDIGTLAKQTLKLPERFKKYEIIIECRNGPDQSFVFER